MRRSRRPFVVTVAMSAALGCSQRTSNPPGITPDASDVSDQGIDDARLDSPATCPAADPGFGDMNKPCDAPAADRCRYRDDCDSRPAGSDENVYACKDDGSGKRVWTLVSNGYVAVCPALQPKNGDPCPCAIHLGYLSCEYGSCETQFHVSLCHVADEVKRTWGVVPIFCNPPEPDASVDSADALDVGG